METSPTLPDTAEKQGLPQADDKLELDTAEEASANELALADKRSPEEQAALEDGARCQAGLGPQDFASLPTIPGPVQPSHFSFEDSPWQKRTAQLPAISPQPKPRSAGRKLAGKYRLKNISPKKPGAKPRAAECSAVVIPLKARRSGRANAAGAFMFTRWRRMPPRWRRRRSKWGPPP